MTDSRSGSGGLLALGILSVFLGFIAIGAPVVASITTALFFGWLILVGGIARTFYAFSYKGSVHFTPTLLSGLLGAVLGLLIVLNPLTAMIGLTLALAIFFIAGGVMQIMASRQVKGQPGSGWALFSGITSLVLGLIIALGWPVSGVGVIGVFVGIELLMFGFQTIGLAMALRAGSGSEGQILEPGDEGTYKKTRTDKRASG